MLGSTQRLSWVTRQSIDRLSAAPVTRPAAGDVAWVGKLAAYLPQPGPVRAAALVGGRCIDAAQVWIPRSAIAIGSGFQSLAGLALGTRGVAPG